MPKSMRESKFKAFLDLIFVPHLLGALFALNSGQCFSQALRYVIVAEAALQRLQLRSANY